MLDTTLLQALIDAHDPAFQARDLVDARLSNAKFLAPFSLDEIRWINKQVDPRRSIQLLETSQSATNLWEYLLLLETVIGNADEQYYTGLIKKHFNCDPESTEKLLGTVETKLEKWDQSFRHQLARRKADWTEVEINALRDGVSQHGYNWKRIKETQPVLAARTSGMQIRDKCWQIRKDKQSKNENLEMFAEEIPGKGAERVKKSVIWSDDEILALEKGLQNYGYNWKKIVETQPQLVAKSGNTEIRDKCWQIRRTGIKAGENMENYRGGLYKESIPGKENGSILSVKKRSTVRKRPSRPRLNLPNFNTSPDADRPLKSILKGNLIP